MLLTIGGLVTGNDLAPDYIRGQVWTLEKVTPDGLACLRPAGRPMASCVLVGMRAIKGCAISYKRKHAVWHRDGF